MQFDTAKQVFNYRLLPCHVVRKIYAQDMKNGLWYWL